MSPPPSLGNIRDDDELLDALGGRRQTARRDDVGDLLAAWVREIDSTGETPTKVRRPRTTHLAAAVGLAVTALSVSSMAAAVTDHRVPVLYQLGTAAGSVLGNPLRAADGGAHKQGQPQGGMTTTSTAAPTPQTTSSGTSPTDLPRSSAPPRASTSAGKATTAQRRPVAPAPTATPDSSSSHDRPTRSTSTKPSTSSSKTKSTTRPSTSTKSTDKPTRSPSPSSSPSESTRSPSKPTSPRRLPTTPRPSTDAPGQSGSSQDATRTAPREAASTGR